MITPSSQLHAILDDEWPVAIEQTINAGDPFFIPLSDRRRLMYAIEFEADIQNGMIKIPSQFQEMESKHVKVIALLDDPEAIKQAARPHDGKQRLFSDDYIDQHWRELIITSSPDPLQDDDAVLQEEYGAYLSAKHSS